MKIVPLVCKSGVFYQVRKWGILESKALDENGKWVGTGSFIDWRLAALKFNSPEEAYQEIVKQFGETAKVKPWVGQ